MSDRYDVIVIGSGPGGASLAPSGKRILLIERGDSHGEPASFLRHPFVSSHPYAPPPRP